MNDQFEEFSDALPEELLRRAYRYRNELAWRRTDAIEAIAGLEKAGFTLIGVEVWVPSSPGPQITWWLCDLGDEVISNKPTNALDFVKNFKWGADYKGLEDREPFFNLEVAEKPN
jgi:hypothetical protein